MILLTTGISGFLGYHLAHLEQADWQITGTYHQHPADVPNGKSIPLDLTDPVAVRDTLETVSPDAILHLAAAANPNSCEQHPELSRAINVDASVFLAGLARERQIPFVFTSTDLIFDGENAPYPETAPPMPLSVYGKHKAEAERRILDSYPGAAIARMPLMYGAGSTSPNFLASWLTSLRSGQSINAFGDEYRSPVSGWDAAAGLFLLLNKGVSGIWHLGGPERLSRLEMALQLAEIFRLDTQLIRPALQHDLPMPAPRPKDVTLASTKAFRLGFHPGKWRENLEILVE